MKKIIGIIGWIWRTICYPLMFLAYQFIFMLAFFVSVTVGLIIDGHVDIYHITEESIMYVFYIAVLNMDIAVIMLLACIFTFLTMWLILRNEWKSAQVWKISGSPILPVILSGLLGIALQYFIGGTIYLTGADALFEEHAELMGMVLGNDLFMEILAIAAGAAIIEELIFRGMILRRFLERTRLKPAYAVILQALLFGVIHMNFLQGFYAFVLGIILGLVYIWVRSIWAPIMLHFTFNLHAVVSSNLTSDMAVQIPSTVELVLATTAAFAVSAVFMMVIYKKRMHTHSALQETVEGI